MVRLCNGQVLERDEDALVVDARRLRLTSARELRPGQWVAQAYGRHLWPSSAPMPPIAVSPLHGSQRCLVLPDCVGVEMARWLGAYAAEGHTTNSNWTTTITNSVLSVLDLVSADANAAFGFPGRLEPQRNRCPSLRFSSKTLVEMLEGLGCGRRASEKRIPRVILDGPRATAIAFLSGLALDAYTTHEQPKWAICLDSPKALDDIQLLLRRLGIVSNRINKHNPTYAKSYGEVTVHGRFAQELVRLVPFLEPEKHARAIRLLERNYQQSAADVVPLISGPELYDYLPRGRAGRNGRGTGRSRWSFLRDPRTRYVSRTTIEVLATAGTSLPTVLQRVLDDGLHFSKVAANPFLTPGYATSRA